MSASILVRQMRNALPRAASGFAPLTASSNHSWYHHPSCSSTSAVSMRSFNNHGRGFSSSTSVTSSSMSPLKSDDAAKKSKVPAKKVSEMSPPELAAELDKYIIGQADAKKGMASAIRYRWRRKQLNDRQREEVSPKNILMIGPTGVGKTEIARRLAKLIDAPFVIAEATKFTEVGFHGRDIESVLRDLMEAGIKMQRKKLEDEYKEVVLEFVEAKLVEALCGEIASVTDKTTWLGHLRSGLLDNRDVTIDIPVNQQQQPGAPGAGPSFRPNQEDNFDYHSDRDQQGGGFGGNMKVVNRGGVKMEKRKMLIKEAREKLLQAELDARITQEEVVAKAHKSVEEDGIIFIDEIDKIVSPKGSYGPDASSEGVQRDLLPIIEGTSVPTKYGPVRSDHVLFVCAGSFHAVKPKDIMAELQGRLPIRINLHPLTEGDFYRILSEPEFSLVKQNTSLLATEGVTATWTECGLREVARMAAEMNTYIENIGARRLHTIMEMVTSDLSYHAADFKGQEVKVDEAYVADKLQHVTIDRSARGLL